MRRVAFLLLLLAACRPEVREADRLYAAGDFGRAAEAYRQFIRDNPKSNAVADAYVGVAWSEYQQGNFPEAEEAVATVRGRFPGSPLEPTAIYIHGLTLFAQNRFVEASNELRELILKFAHDPIVPEARFLLARSEASLLRYAAAAEDYAHYLEKYGSGPYAAAALVGRAAALGRIARWQEAAAVLAEFIDRFPRHPDRPRAMIDLARYREAYGEYGEAEEILARFRREYSIPELEIEALERLAAIYELTRRTDEAANLRRKFYDLLPLNADTDRAVIALRLAEHHAVRGETDAALAYYTRIRDRHSAQPVAHARALEWLARYELARGYRENAVALAEEFLARYFDDPASERMERLVIGVFIEAGRHRDARERLVTLLRKTWSTAEPPDFYRVGTLDIQLRDYKHALEWIREGRERAERIGDTPAILSGLYQEMIVNDLEGNLARVVENWWRLEKMQPTYVTVSEKMYWDEKEQQLYRLNRSEIPDLAQPADESPYQIAVHLHGFERPIYDTLAVNLAASLTTILTSAVTVHADMRFVPRANVRHVENLVRLFDFKRVPDEYFPLRSNIGADWIVHGEIRRENEQVLLYLRLLRVDYDGIFPFEYLYRIAPEEIVTAPSQIARETIQKLRLYRPDR